MQITSQLPAIQCLPAFLCAMAEALENMHGRGLAHGCILSARPENWLDEQRHFQAATFESTRASASLLADGADPIAEDVRGFAAFCIRSITGQSASSLPTFTAALYQGTGWSLEFLQLLETISKQEVPPGISMADLSRALKQTSVEPDACPRTEPPPVREEPPAPVLESPASESPSAASAPFERTVPTPAVRIALRNATVGKAYHYEPGVIASKIAETFGHDPAHARLSHLQLPEDCGLSFDQHTGAISGIPTRAFDGELRLDYLPSLSAASISAKLTLLINPDPATLWKDLPPPSDAPYVKKSLDQKEECLGPYRVVAASRRGRSHANKGEFRDDDYAFGYAEETGWLVVVVADGAGSAPYSRRGSQIACAAAKSQLLAVLNSVQHNQAEALYQEHREWQHPEVRKALRQTLYAAAYMAHKKIDEEVQNPSEPLPAPPRLRNYDTTLILLVMKKNAEGCVAASFSIGDGGAGLLPHPGEGIPLTKADSGDHAGQTLFVTFPSTLSNTEENLESRFHLEHTQEFAGVLVMTDGITDPKFPSDAAFADPAQWAALWSELQPGLTSSQALLDWMNFFSPGNHDDRTLVAVLPAPPAAPEKP